MRQILFNLAALAAFTLCGCGGDAPPSSPPAAAKAPTTGTSAAKPAADQLLVSIIPDPPTADGCLKALVSGTRKAGYRWEVNGQELPGQTTNTLCEGLKRGDELRVVVRDGKRTGSRQTTTATAPPRITAVSVNADGLPRHADLVVTPTVIDVDGDPVELRFQWYVNGEADPFLTESTLPADRYVRGDALRFSIVATDGKAESKLYQSATVTVPNTPPQILSKPPQRFEALDYRYQVKAKDPDGGRLAFTLAKAPPGMTIDRATGAVAWPLSGVRPGAYPVRIVVRDPEGAEAFQEYTLSLGQVPAAAKP